MARLEAKALLTGAPAQNQQPAKNISRNAKCRAPPKEGLQLLLLLLLLFGCIWPCWKTLVPASFRNS
jgi:hypothetical protein